MSKNEDIKKPRRNPLPLAEEDIRGSRAGDPTVVRPVRRKASVSFVKLFFTIIVAAPVAMVLSLAASDLYDQYAPMAKKPKATTADNIAEQTPAGALINKATPGDSADRVKLAFLIEALEKSNKSIATALDNQTKAVENQTKSIEAQGKALEKIANAKPQVAQASSARSGKTPKIIVVKVPSREKFDLQYELQKILTLSGVDLDDPITSSAQFDAISSRGALKEVLGSLNTIIAASRNHAEVGEFLVQNSLKAKKYVQARLKKVR